MKPFGNDLVPVYFLSDWSIGAFDASPRMVDDFHLDSQVLFDPRFTFAVVATVCPNELEVLTTAYN